MRSPLQIIRDIRDQKKYGRRRSPHWRKLRNEFLKGKRCAVCGGTRKLEAHHIIPFHIDPSKELDPSNLIPLCEGKRTLNCHLIFGHFGNFRTKYNVNVKKDAKKWNKRLTSREVR